MTTTSATRADRGGWADPGRLDALHNSSLAGLLVSIALVVAATGIVALMTPAVPADAAGVIYLVAVLGASSLCGLWWGLGTSLASALAFNFFFLPPQHTLVINSSSDWAALGAFTVTAVVTSNLAARWREEREEASRRASEAALSESLATLIANASDLESVLPSVGGMAAHALGAADGAIHRGTPAPESRRGSVLPLEINGHWMGELRLIDAPPGALEAPAARRVARSLAGLIALGEERERRLHQQVHAEALNRSNELKTALLRAVSHDLRSPLMAITAAAGGLRYAELDDDDRELLQTITDQGARMSRMIENLLDLSKLQSGAASPSMDWLDPRELVEAAVEEVAPGEEQQRRVRLQLDRDLPLVRGDAGQLQRVLVNLIENALKFSPPDEPVAVAVTGDRRHVEVAVSDHGPGIPRAEAERIFEPFYRAADRPDVGGSGLGLAIAQGLAVANGCTLVLDPEVERGSRFLLTMPAPWRPTQ